MFDHAGEYELKETKDEQEDERQEELENGCETEEDTNAVQNVEDSHERQDETESENEDIDCDEQNPQSPETNPPVTRSKSKKKIQNTCDKCLKNFRTSSGLKHHKRCCKGDNTKQHKCPHCDKSFTWQSHLKVY